MQHCSLQHWTLLPSPVTYTTGCCFHFGSVSSFFLELFLLSSPVTYWASTNLGSSSFSVISFCLSYCSWGSQGKNTEVVCHSLLQWITFCQLGSKITADGDHSHEIKILLLLGRKAMTNLDSILKSKDITLLTKVHLIRAMYGFSSSHTWMLRLDHKEG